MNARTVVLAGRIHGAFYKEVSALLHRKRIKLSMFDLERPRDRPWQGNPPVLAIVTVETETGGEGLRFVTTLRKDAPNVPVIMVAAHSSEARIIAALRMGVSDYIKWPSSQELLEAVQRIAPSPSVVSPERRRSQEERCAVDQHLIGESKPMRRIKEYLLRASVTDTSILVTGETGTGKECVAELIHRQSRRSARRLICINCAAVPDTLLESELFGYEKGAFTGAGIAYEGKLKLAEGGTAFFDEIGEMSALAQTKVLRAIENKQAWRLGGRKEISLDFRIVTATNCNLEAMVEEGSFRKDLYYRLNVARIYLPPLRDRKEDIPLLIDHELESLNTRFDTTVTGVDEQAMAVLLRYHWPGNVRELKNVIEAAFINQPRTVIRLNDLPESLIRLAAEDAAQSGSHASERDTLLTALLATNWNKSQAARKLNWSRMTVYRKMQKYHIEESRRGSSCGPSGQAVTSPPRP